MIVRPLRSQNMDFSGRTVRQTLGFTLLEVLISMTILTFLVVILMSMVDSATKLWRQNENRVDSYREARAAANLIAADLASIAPTGNTNFFQIDTTASNVQSLSVPDTNNIFFLTAQPTSTQGESADNTRGNLCAVGYFLAKESGSGNSPRNLYRYFRNSSSTLEKCFPSPGNLIPDALSVSATDQYVEQLARNITSFRVKPFTVTSAGLVAFDQTKHSMPDLLEVEFTALNNETAKQLTDWSDINSISNLPLSNPSPTPAP